MHDFFGTLRTFLTGLVDVPSTTWLLLVKICLIDQRIILSWFVITVMAYTITNFDMVTSSHHSQMVVT